MKTIVGLFDNFNDAQSVVSDLVNSGFDRSKISMVANDASGQYSTSLGTGGGSDEGIVRDTDSSAGPVAESAGTGAKAGAYVGGALGLLAGLGALAIPGVGPVIAAGPIMTALGSTALGAGLGAATGGLIGGLVGLGVPQEEAGYYSEGVRRGGTLVTVSADDAMAQQAVDVLNRHNAVDIDQRGSYYQQSGYTGFDTSRPAYSADELTTYRQSNPNIYGTTRSTTMDTMATPAVATPAVTTTGTTATTASGTAMTGGTQTVEAGDRVAIPIVEEQIAVGTREVERGGARIHTRVEERPVSEQVNLREEHVTVERHAVNQPVTDATAAFREGTIEVTERSEVPVVSKEARVVEEVVIGKEATQRTETVSDTVRRTDVDVEEVNSTTTGTTGTTTTHTSGTSNS